MDIVNIFISHGIAYFPIIHLICGIVGSLKAAALPGEGEHQTPQGHRCV